MIISERKYPLKILFNNAAIGRLLPHHPKIPVILEDNRRKEAGHIGEQRLDRLLTTKLPPKDYHIFQGLHIPNKDGTYFQIDNLLYTATHIIPTEVKYMSGELSFDRASRPNDSTTK
ncbi:nuclease-related domain-containing protein [Bacillus sp. T3]|uniref:nuclease-related domain-containing protein n=1 Tax=Bacillus sp. T3 TaxID=467262 RepID=UPI002980B5FA|nr:nuclease-related domain-containing protein [Bacillus sp. T3]